MEVSAAVSAENNVTKMTTTMMGVNSTTSGTPTVMNNYTTTTTEPQLSTAFVVSYYVLKFIFVGFAIFGNTLTIVAVARFKKLQTNTNYLLCSLALGDMLGSMQAPVDLAHEIIVDKPIFVTLCLNHLVIGSISYYLTFSSIALITIDRYILIAHPLHYPRWVTTKKVLTVIGINWVVIITELTAIFVFTHDIAVGKPCRYPDVIPGYFHLALLTPQLHVYSCLIIAFNVAICRIAYKQGKAIATLDYRTYEATLLQQHKKIAMMLMTVIGVGILCFTPLLIGTLIRGTSSQTSFWLHYDKVAALIYWLNIWLNPVIYVWRCDDFRIAFRKVLKLKPVAIPYVI